FDKARAAAGGTIYDYVYPCPMDRGVFQRWGVTPEDFDRAIQDHVDDDAILRWAESHISDSAAKAANDWLLTEKVENLDRQDREEGVA
ncbi:MAG TPA: DUF5069 domain-containing protein, partial [Candidatus Tyrphobacter sp.]